MNNIKVTELVEYVPKFLPANEMTQSVGTTLWQNYGKQVSIEFPSPKTNNQWQLTSQGWVGYIPITTELGISLLPKVSLRNLFRMLEYAYRLNSFRFLDGLTTYENLQDFYERIANVLALRILDRGRKGLYRAYNDREDNLPYISGRLNIQHLMKKPWDANVQCQYQEYIADIEENQILNWTLYKIARSGLCSSRVLPTIRRAFRSLQGKTNLVPYTSKDCLGRLYNRLNQDYRPMHALCRFFLDQSGPSHGVGEYIMLPFLVDMARLYELFIAEWLKINLPKGYELKLQEKVEIGDNKEISFAIDLVIYDLKNNYVRAVLDTKYKSTNSPLTSDIQQIVTYALIKNCKEAILVYPSKGSKSFDQCVGDIKVRSLCFNLGEDIEEAGKEFLKNLFT